MLRHLTCLLLLTTVCSNSPAAELSAKPFSVVYTLHKGGLKVGESELSVNRTESTMRWQLTSRASGIYALLTDKEPYSESVLQRLGKDYRLASLEVSSNREDQPKESAKFDWQKSKINIQRKGKSKSLKLNNSVFDYLSIHWLSAQMTINSGTRTEFDFYRKGKLVKSTLKLVGQSEINVKEQTRLVRLYEQSFNKSKTLYKYFYDLENPLLPIKIERIKPGKDSRIMLFDRLN